MKRVGEQQEQLAYCIKKHPEHHETQQRSQSPGNGSANPAEGTVFFFSFRLIDFLKTGSTD
ncbi:hypothetical protein P4C99_14215 [Pontiellaceae bacterium B1224]|nr:hypothetical protein [Pontiellaceae bacterium B1224]